jgi:hypothetical protein
MRVYTRKSYVLAAFGGVGALLLGLFGCGGGSSLSKPFGTNPNDTNKERAFNALIDVPGGNVDIVQRGVDLGGQSVLYGQATGYATVASGIAVKTNVFQAGTQNRLAPEGSSTMVRDFFYTEAAIGVIGGAGGQAPRLIQIADNFPDLSSGNNAAIRLVNFSPGSPGLSLFNTAGSPPTAVAVIGATAISYGTASGYVVVAGGSYNFTIRDNAGNVLATVGPQTLQFGHAYTLFARGRVNAPAGSPPFIFTFVQDE